MADTSTFDTYSDPMGTTDFTATANAGSPDNAPSVLSVDYYRQKVVEFQNVLSNLDSVYVQLQDVGSLIGDDPDAYQQWLGLVNEFEDKRSTITNVAQAINAASQAVNAVGVQFPTLQLAGLGLPVIPIAIVAAAVTSAAALIYWFNDFTTRLLSAITTWKTLGVIQNLSPDQQASALQQFGNAQVAIAQAQAAADKSPVTAAANAAKYLVIGLALWIGYKIYKGSK